jgi:hypothetical protein
VPGTGQVWGQTPDRSRKDLAHADTNRFDTESNKEEAMPWGSWVNELPTEFFMAVHIAAFALGAGFAWLAFKRELSLLATAFTLFAAAELTYMTYHLDWTVFLFAHTIAEVFDLVAFVLVFAAAVLQVVPSRKPALESQA